LNHNPSKRGFSDNLLSSSKIENSDQLAPLLWMTNVYAMKILWPKNGNNGNVKPQYIIENTQTCKRKLLVKDSNYVLLHRFSAKEQHRRLTAAPLKGKIKIRENWNRKSLELYLSFGWNIN
jgi:membrane-bound metal-dependent hydrolase YbcI (DUF457 family)